MKGMKKVVSLVAAAVMVFALAVPVNAAEAEVATTLPAAENGVIKLTCDVELAEQFVVAKGTTVTLDLNGYTVSRTDSSGKGAALISNSGDLTIVDSSSAGTGKLTFVSTTPSANNGYSTSTIINNGDLTVESGIIENTTSAGPSYAIDTSWYSNDVSVTIEGGEILSKKVAVRQVLFESGYNNTVTVTDGLLSGGSAGLQIHSYASKACKAETNISGGVFEGTYAFYSYYTGASISSETNVTITDGTFNGYVFLYNPQKGSDQYPMKVDISGGTFNDGAYVYVKDAEGGEVAIPSVTGGTFIYEDVQAYVKAGYDVVEQANGTFIVCNHTGTTVTDKAVVATCTEVGYTEGSHCANCNTVFKAQTEIPAKGHKTEVINAKAATCTEAGYTGDKYCSVCKTTVEKGVAIAATGHTYVNGACACGDKLEVKVETEVVDTITKEEVKVEEVKEVTVVEDENTVKAEISVKAETTVIATEVAKADDVKETEAVKSGAITETTAEAVKEAVLAGDTVKTEIVVNEVKTETVPTSAQANIEKAAATVGKNAEVVQYLDVSVVLKAASTGEELGTVNKLATPIKVTVAIPENLKAENVKYVVIRDHNGTITKLPTTVNANGTITFETDMFSTYALAVADADTTAPKTDDPGMASAAWVAIVAVAGIAFVAARRRSVVR